MNIAEVINRLELEVLNNDYPKSRIVTWGYTSDMLSDVMGNASEGNLWITMQAHRNIVAVASLKELSGILLINGQRPDSETLALAEKEGVTILVCKLSAFETAGRLYQLLKENENVQS